ncbi:MAG: hypothetical protein ACFFC6_11360 [Promethearchaeota archaeon]
MQTSAPGTALMQAATSQTSYAQLGIAAVFVIIVVFLLPILTQLLILISTVCCIFTIPAGFMML